MERGGVRAGERVIRTVERLVVADKMEYCPAYQRDAEGTLCKYGIKGSAIITDQVEYRKPGFAERFILT